MEDSSSKDALPDDASGNIFEHCLAENANVK